ncbi:MAG: synthase subunit gamma [Alphaproteobacteria bacterium]|jgi:F-type H+-transporting ATPase subunit gamma|nr:synthase subunit gamma [Alphaproteobacteria bacterium]
MPSLKDFRTRIASVKSTRKITSAMKMVAASKLRRAQLQAEASRPYAKKMAEMLSRLVSNVTINSQSPFLLGGTGRDQNYLVVVVTSDRGLAGGFNAFVTRLARQRIRQLVSEGKNVKIVTVGRKGRESLKRDHVEKILHSFEGIGRKRLAFAETRQITDLILDLGLRGEFDVCEVIYNQFRSVVRQDPTVQQIIPLPLDAAAKTEEKGGLRAIYEFEPDEEELLATLLPRNLSIQIFKTLLDSAAGEQAARMQAMDNATRNAGDMIAKLTLRYNRARQAYITKELIEIISGAEAV